MRFWRIRRKLRSAKFLVCNGWTEQIFRIVCVFTADSIPRKEQTVVGVPFVLKRIAR